MRTFWEKHPDCEQQLKSWFQEMEQGSWDNFITLKKEFPGLSILKDHRACFNIKGNTYRLIVKINFHYQLIWIRLVGTHAEYDKINANKI